MQLGSTHKDKMEIQVETFKIMGKADEYPLHKGRVPLETLRQHLNLRSRTALFQAIWKIKSELLMAMHLFFKSQQFVLTTPPILTGNDCEGGGDSFSIVNSSEFFGKPVYATVSTQLHLEMLCQGLSRVYSISPCFRAEKSNSPRHLAEFWMLEAEISFVTELEQLTSFVTDQIKYVVAHVLSQCKIELEILERMNPNLIASLEKLQTGEFVSIKYSQAQEILQKSGLDFEFDPTNGLQTEHEKYLAEEYSKGPIFITNYPHHQKPFYMKKEGNESLCFDLILPGWGEIVGGSLREDSFSTLVSNMSEHGLKLEDYEWYLESRKFGSFPHGGYGLGVERMLGVLTGMANIKDLIPMPRFNGSCKY